MSSKRKQPFRSLPQPPATPRWAPSTPHAIRALQQRSGGRRKSANIHRPDSARNILRQLARITAAQTKRKLSTPQIKPSPRADKENAYSPSLSQSDENIENGEELERPDFTLPIEEGDEDEDAGLAPTQRELPGGEDYTFKSIDFAEQHSRPPTSIRSERIRRSSRFSILAFPDEEDAQVPDNEEDLTAQSIEYGRRAISEGPMWDRYPRSSFGSIRMSEFGLEESRFDKEPEGEKSLMLDDQHANIGTSMENEIELDEGSETEDLRRYRQSMSEPLDDRLFAPDLGFVDDDNSFRLDFGREEPPTMNPGLAVETEDNDGSERAAEDPSSMSLQQSPSPGPQSPDAITRQMTQIEAAGPSRGPRRKKLKLTHNGKTVPALPSSLVKRVAVDSMTRMGKKRPTINRESLAALEQATEWFFEQVGEDLEAYSNHAKRRKRVDNVDVLVLMRRQRVLGQGQSLEDLAQEYLSDEILLDLDLPDGT